MSYTKTIVCLANSIKERARCIAGQEVGGPTPGPWIRPIVADSRRENDAVQRKDSQFVGGGQPTVLDVVDVPLNGACPTGHQTENHSIDLTRRWQRVGRITWAELGRMVETLPTGTLWIDGCSSSVGTNDRVPDSSLASISSSLYLIRPERLTITNPTNPYANPRVPEYRADFSTGATRYLLKITDDTFTAGFPLEPDSSKSIDDAVICVSLAQPYKGYAYKLAAAIITPARAAPTP